MKFSFVILNGLFAGAIAVPTSNSVVHEKRDVTNTRWTKRSTLSGDSKIPARIALKQRNTENGMDLLMNVADPDSPNYGKHLSQQEVIELFAPDSKSVDAVKNWLIKSGVPANKITVPRSKGWVNFDTTVSQLEGLLGAKYHAYDHISARHAHIGTDEYHLPREISDVVSFVTPGVVFAPTKALSTAAQKRANADKADLFSTRQPFKPFSHAKIAELAATGCDTLITTDCIRDIYQIPKGSTATSGNQMGIFEYSGDVYAQADLDSYYAAYAPDVPSGTGPKVDNIDGASAPGPVSSAGGESDMDFELAIPLIYPQTTELYESYVQNNDIFNTWLDAVDGSYCTSTAYGETGDDPTVDGTTQNEECGTHSPANVISVSYGTAEADYPTYYLQRQCDEFMKLSLQGSTIVLSSGDDGVARRSGPCLGTNQDIFTPGEPASCPYVTSVGSTVLPQGSANSDPQTATTEFSSGGGFSNIFTTPDFQKDAVASYFANNDPGYKYYNTSGGNVPDSGGIYNRAGRGYPDVAALGQNIAVYVGGQAGTSGGTSASAPIMGSIFTLINEARLGAGKKTIGWANPALYKNPSMFTDVTTGMQDKGGPNGDGQASACGNNGFSAVSGWDPVTGLGTPNFPAMLKYFNSLP